MPTHSTTPSERHAAPAVSVVMPVHNTPQYVEEAVSSILAQSFQDFELLVVDDGSNNETRALLCRLEGTDPRIKVFYRDHSGISPTRNFAVQQAKAPLIANLDSDDVALPNRLQQQVDYLSAHPECEVVGGQALQIDPEGAELGPIVVKLGHDEIVSQLEWGRGLAVIHSAAMFRKASFDPVGGYDNSLPKAEDLDLYLKLAERGKLANLPDDLILVRRHLSSVTALSAPGTGTQIKQRVLEAAYRRTGRDPSQVSIREFPYPRSEADLLLGWIETASAYGYKSTSKKYTRRFMKRYWHNPHQLSRLMMRKCQPFTQRARRAPRILLRRLTKGA